MRQLINCQFFLEGLEQRINEGQQNGKQECQTGLKIDFELRGTNTCKNTNMHEDGHEQRKTERKETTKKGRVTQNYTDKETC